MSNYLSVQNKSLEKLKVLLVSHVGYPWGGISQRYSDLLESSLTKIIDLTFFESSPNKTSISQTGKLDSRNLINFVKVTIDFLRTLLHLQPLIVHVASANGLSFIKHSILIIISKLFGAKVILAPHCSISVFIPKSTIPFRWMQFILNQCDGLIILSSEWLSIKHISSKPKIILLKNAIYLKNYLQLERPMKNPNAEVTVIYLGHVGVTKGIFDLIHAVKILETRGIKSFRVCIYGEEMRLGELNKAKKLAESLSITGYMKYLEPVFGNKKIDVFRNADIFVLPSYHEGLPISIIEAMASGLPIIATRVGGIPDLVDDLKNGILINSQSPHDLANALMTLIQNKQLCDYYGSEGRKRASENHDVEKYVDRLVHFYEEICME